jgi:hypothetical protein
MDGPILAQLVGPVVLGLPVLHLSAASVVDAADELERVEDEPGFRLTFYLDRDELHALHVQAIEEPGEPVMNHRNAERCPAEVQRVPGNIQGEARGATQIERPSFLELPRVELLSSLVERRTKMPSAS